MENIASQQKDMIKKQKLYLIYNWKTNLQN